MNNGALQLIATALTPVVLVSAAALIAIGIAQKHSALGDRIRALSAELRKPDLSARRRQSVRVQLGLFAVRSRRASAAHQLMYLSIACFLGMILVLTLQASRSGPWGSISLSLFLLGVGVMFAGIVTELLELHLANRTLDCELEEDSADSQPRDALARPAGNQPAFDGPRGGGR